MDIGDCFEGIADIMCLRYLTSPATLSELVEQASMFERVEPVERVDVQYEMTEAVGSTSLHVFQISKVSQPRTEEEKATLSASNQSRPSFNHLSSSRSSFYRLNNKGSYTTNSLIEYPRICAFCIDELGLLPGKVDVGC